MARFAVIGLGQFGDGLARALAKSGAEVIAVDRDAELVERIRDHVTLAVRLDSTDEESLQSQAIADADVVVVSIGVEFESSALTVAALKGMGAKYILARAHTRAQAKILTSIGANKIVNPEGETALRWAHRLMLPNLQKYLEIGDGYCLVDVPAPTVFFHKTPAQLRLRGEFGVNLIAIKRSPEAAANADATLASATVIPAPAADTEILPGDVLILVGSNESLAALPCDARD